MGGAAENASTTRAGSRWAMARSLVAPSLAVAILCSGGAARADVSTPEERATKLFEKGRALAREGRCGEAVPVLLESVREAASIGAMLNLGNCYETLGKTATAHRQFKRAEETAIARGDPRSAEAHSRAEALAPTLSTIRISVADASEPQLALRLDDETIPSQRWGVAFPVDPGSHVLEMSSPRRGRTLETIVVRGGGDRAAFVVPTLVSGPPRAAAVDDAPHGDTQRLIGYGVGGAGAIGVVVGSVFGILSIARHGDVVDRCPTYPTCSAADRANIDADNRSAQSAGDVSTVAFVVGGALLVGGAILVLTAPNARRETRQAMLTW
ncbi:MAG: tetratricopeptide repeat protein [Deltaproteobacteria bacterium]|nr:tetratricopeptide repeat protein [Deltaproteobacteria bacterium]